MTPQELGAEVLGTDGGQALDSAKDSTTMLSRLEDKVDPETLRKLEALRNTPK
jgi:hypothetical protein